MMPTSDSRSRLNVLRKILAEEASSTQEELVKQLRHKKYHVTQSTISRDLRRIGAIKTTDASGNTIYRLPEEGAATPLLGLRGLLFDIQSNEMMIVIHTSPGSASLVARHLDQTKPQGILGTLAGDDTVFVAPASASKIPETMKSIVEEFS